MCHAEARSRVMKHTSALIYRAGDLSTKRKQEQGLAGAPPPCYRKWWKRCKTEKENDNYRTLCTIHIARCKQKEKLRTGTGAATAELYIRNGSVVSSAK